LSLAGRLLAAVGDAVVGIDREGRIICWTGASERLFDLAAEQVLGQPITSVFPGVVRNDPIEVSTLAGAEKLEAVRRIGLHGPVTAITMTPLRDEHGGVAGTVALIRPMGSWLDPVERAERPQRQWHRTLRAILQDLIKAAAEDGSVMDASEALAARLVASATELIPDAERVLAIVPREEQECLKVVAGAGPWAERQVGTEWPRTGTLAGRSLQDGRALESTRLRELGEPIPEQVEGGGVQSGRFVPLRSTYPLADGRQALGVLAFYRTTRTYFTPYERRLIAEFARLVTLSLQRPEILRSACTTSAKPVMGVDEAAEFAMIADNHNPSEIATRLVWQAIESESVDAERTGPPRIQADGQAQRPELVQRPELAPPVTPQPRTTLVPARTGKPLEAAGSPSDTSPRARVESRVVAGRLPEQVLHALADAVIAIDRNGLVVAWNQAAERLLGMMADEALGQPLPEAGIPMGKLLVGRDRRVTLRSRDGREFPTTVTTTALPGPDEGAVLIIKDMTPWIGPSGHNMSSPDTLTETAVPAHGHVDDDQVVRSDSTASHSVETRILGFLAWLLPARERERFVVEARANLEFCDSLFQRIDFLLATACGTPRLAFMLRRAGRRRSGD
jgi:PAS domain S-box-containing protein